MSVNITVNGKFAKHCRPYSVLDDPQEVRKAEEKERRKLRLLEVREESKKLAKKIRDEVNEEKKRELQKLQATKERELECWRQHALQRKGEEYREAIFQIGTAHQAAKTDNEQRAEKQQGTYKNFKKQMAARKCQPGKVKFSCQTTCPCQQTPAGAKKQFKCTCTQTDKPSTTNKYNDEAHKRKRDVSFSSSESECEDEGYKEQTTLPQTSFSLSSSCDSTSSSFINNQAVKNPAVYLDVELGTDDSVTISTPAEVKDKHAEYSMFVPTKNKCLVKTPAVYLDVEVGTDDSVSISAPAEIKDKHAEYNRQFSSVIRVSPRKGRKEKENTSENPCTQQSSTTTTLTSDTTAKQMETNKAFLEKSQPTKAVASKEKRFTIISDLVKKQQKPKTNTNNQGPSLATLSQATSAAATPLLSPRKQGPTFAPLSQATSAAETPLLSPRKQLRETAQRPPLARPQTQSPRKASATSKSSRTITDNTQPVTSFTATTKSNTAVVSTSSSSGRVQFFDYNSKLAKERDQSAAAVSVQRQRDQTQPTAMEQAELENQRERDSRMEALKKCQQMEERGQKALEREQVRRDCNELTEKLEALTREYPNQVPTNENQLHLFADKQLRKEGKMNTAVEKLLQRPTIITCSELNNPKNIEIKPKILTSAMNLVNELNVAALNNKPLPAEDVSSDSCCSILLGYVDDQSRLVKQDLQSNEATQSQSKQKRLQNLLKRLDQLRTSLVQELKTESESTTKKRPAKEENIRLVIDSISEMRKEREQLLTNEKVQEPPKPLRAREKELLAKEALLEQKVREFYELQKQPIKTNDKKLKRTKSKEEKQATTSSSKDNSENSENNSNDKENVVCTSEKNPLEIIITVKGETACVKVPQKPKRKMLPKKSPSRLSTLIRSPQMKKHTPKKKTPAAKPSLAWEGVLRRQNSYDSNSTSYMSLPPEMPNKINDLATHLAKERQQPPAKNNKITDGEKQITSTQDRPAVSEISLEPFDTPRSNQPPRINPLIAQYVQRLLGMSRNAVQKLGVSSSDIETPGSSIINTTGNITNSDTLISDERLIYIQNFMEENCSFINDLEQSMKSQNNVSLENSMRMFDDIWRKRFKIQPSINCKNKQSQDKTETKEKTRDKDNKIPQNSSLKTKRTSKDINVPQANKPLASSSKTIERKLSTDDLLKDLGRSLSSHYSSDDKESLKSSKIQKRTIQKADKAIDAKLSTDSSKAEPDSQIARYAKLTENCTHRIAELTELINRVREEKQRLLEVTLSSVSENGRQSTEYLELPEGKTSTRHDQDDLTRVSSSSEETTQNKQSLSTDTLNEMPKLSSADKHKQITASRDSGIAESRPITALENRIDQEPFSQTSSESTMHQPVRKLKPPPTLKRFSPQLPEEELAHELSTILEVDTPVTSRINTAAAQSADDRENASDTDLQQPVKFPTFEQYIQQLNLDINQLNPEQSIHLQQEFTTFLECLQQNRSPCDPPQYTEFPSISAYIQHLSEADHQLGETMEESLAQLRISGIHPRNFPVVREYIKHNTSKSSPDEQQLLDTESLENITEEPTQTNTDDTASLDIEEELKRRKILKNSFRFIETKKQQIFSSTAHKDAAFFQEIIAAESGVDKLSTSGNTSDLLDSDLRRMVQQWPGEVRRKSKDVKILSSTTTSTNASALANSALRAASLDDSSKNTGQALNLRDFLTRELLKHVNLTASSSNSSSDDSLRNHFLHSLIGSLTPRTPGAASKSGAMTLDRQKTSTPVPMQSSQTHSTASTRSNGSSQLFSGESRLSSVHYQDRSVRFFTSDGDKADQSSE